MMYGAYTICYTSTLTVANWVISGPIWAWNVLVSAFNGVTAFVDWCWASVKWLAYKSHCGVKFAMNWTLTEVTFAFEWSWVKLKQVAEVAWDGTMWIVYWIWVLFTRVVEVILYGVWLTGSGIWSGIVWLGNIIARHYNLYLQSKLSVKTLSVTTRDVLPAIPRPFT